MGKYGNETIRRNPRIKCENWVWMWNRRSTDGRRAGKMHKKDAKKQEKLCILYKKYIEINKNAQHFARFCLFYAIYKGDLLALIFFDPIPRQIELIGISAKREGDKFTFIRYHDIRCIESCE